MQVELSQKWRLEEVERGSAYLYFYICVFFSFFGFVFYVGGAITEGGVRESGERREVFLFVYLCLN